MDGTETPEGLSSEGQTSEGDKETPKQTKTYTEAELQKAKSDALAAAGRDAKSLADKEAALKAEKDAIEAEKAKIADWNRQREQAELEEARKDPDKLSAWQKRQDEKKRDAEFARREADLNKKEADLRKKEAEHEAEITAAKEAKLEMSIFEVSGKYNINPTVLKDGMKDLGLSTPEQAEALAKQLGGTPKRPGETELHPAPGVTSGVGRKNYASIQFDKNAPSAKDMITKGLGKK